MGTYTTAGSIYNVIHATGTEVPIATLNQFIEEESSYLDEKSNGNPAYKEEYFENEHENRFIQMEDVSSVSDFDRVYLNGKRLFEWSRDNLIHNPDVDEGDSSVGTVNYWTSSGSNSTLSWQNSVKHTGNKAFKILADGSNDEDAFYYSSQMSINNNEPYRVSGWIEAGNVTGNGSYIGIQWGSGSNTIIKTDRVSYVTSTSGTFIQYSGTFTAPYNATWAQFIFGLSASVGSAYGDQFYFSKVNWQKNTGSAYVELTKEPYNKRVNVRYIRTAVPIIVKRICTLRASVSALDYMINEAKKLVKYKIGDMSVDKKDQLISWGSQKGKLQKEADDLEEKFLYQYDYKEHDTDFITI